MNDHLKDYLMPRSLAQRPLYLREYLQWLILKSLDERGWRDRLAFVGGTALRLIYHTGRFSEDLDFSLVHRGGYDTRQVAQQLQTDLTRWGLAVEVTTLRDRTTVGSFFLRFPGLLYTLGLTHEPTQKLSIKVEVDTHPPEGWGLDEYLFQDPLLFVVTHFDLASLFATKLHAFLYRGFNKGRDYYDLLFFLNKQVPPNSRLFQNAVRQTHPTERYPAPATLFAVVRRKLEQMDDRAIQREVHPFLLQPDDIRYLRAEILLKALAQFPGAQ
ncbi:MAG: nucleotidyl transferase AbiEii/AbiGii toxin family protein [Elusimicrobia bacterium]|nr:nucleotidyl transferase AbiEii/AbiGii toxin family protein [Elusimicrobiota bacterium]